MTEPLLNADRPVSTVEEDLLERSALVTQLASWVRAAPVQEGFVIGLTGPWGSGKTSVLRLLERLIEDDESVVIWFEPWLFSGANELVGRFFDEVAGQLADGKGKRARKLGAKMAGYGAALSPAAGIALGPAGELLAAPQRLGSMRDASASTQRERLRSSLLKNPCRIVVLIDDIDRLDQREVREVLRLVKLVADLPGVVHVLSYDRKRVEAALGESGLPQDGRAYLEKIVQASMAVPPVSKDRLRSMTMEWLNASVGERPLGAWDESRWTSLLSGGIDGYLTTPRDGRRLANTVPAALDLCQGEVDPMDVIALEAMRIFDPDVHEALINLTRVLTGRAGIHFQSATEAESEDQAAVAAALETSSNPDAARTLLQHLFPVGAHHFGGSRHGHDNQWRTQNRVASRSVFLRYLHRSLATDEVPSAAVDGALAALSDAEALRELLAGVEDKRLADLVERTRARAEEQADIDVLGCSEVLLNLATSGRVPNRGLLIGGDRRIRWLVETLVETVEPASERILISARVVRRAPTLSWRIELLFAFRVPEDGESREPALDLFDEALFLTLQHEIAQQIQAAPPQELATESNGLWLLDLLAKDAGASAVINKLSEPEVLISLLTTEGSAVRPQTSGPAIVHVRPLINIAGPDVLPLLQELASSADIDEPLRRALETELTNGPMAAPDDS